MAIVKIEGTGQVLRNLEIMRQKVFNFLSRAVEEVGQEGKREAQKHCPVDTGALKQSIDTGITKVIPQELVEGQVGVGSDIVIRGEGRFEYSRKTGYKVIKQTTKEYAEKVEEKNRFMTTTYEHLLGFTPRKVASLLREAIKRI